MPLTETEPSSYSRKFLVDWLVDRALPTWSRNGVDHKAGGFFEKLSLAGEPVEEARRTRVVARQIYVFATAARHGWLPEADALVDHGLRFLFDVLRLPDGSFAAAALPDGRIVRPQFDLYEHAFVLFALASACRGRPARRGFHDEALNLLHLMRGRWRHPTAGFEEASPRSLPLKSNPHMHLFEAALAWLQVCDDGARPTWQALADELAELCLARFIHPQTSALHEYFDGDWVRASGSPGQVVEPGHQFEWAWLLMRWGASKQRADALAAADRLLDIGETRGVDAVRGVAVNELSQSWVIGDASAKLWPQTERIKAWHAARWAGSPGHAKIAASQLDQAVDGLALYLLPAPSGLWHEQMSADGSFAWQDCRASSLYHIVCAVDTLHDGCASIASVGESPIPTGMRY